MVSDDSTNLSHANGPATPEDEGADEETKAIGGRATKDQKYLVDRACLELGITRGQFVVEAAVERARTVLAAKSVLESKPA